MNLSPWNYWEQDGRPKKHTSTILATLEAVIERDPTHEGVLHYYIHAVEPVDAERGLKAADGLRGLAPGAGHLVHMPPHIYMQVSMSCTMVLLSFSFGTVAMTCPFPLKAM